MRIDERPIKELLALGVFGRGSRLGERIGMLLARGREFSPEVSRARMAVSGVALLGCVMAGAIAPRWIAFAQTNPNAAFEAASVRLVPLASGPVTHSFLGGPGTDDPGQITYTNVTLRGVLADAYRVGNDQVSGPGWMGSENYVILAKVPAGATKEEFRVMMQNLLKERFHLTLHHEIKDAQNYELTTVKGGTKLKASAEPAGANPAASSEFFGRNSYTGPLDKDGFPQLAPGQTMATIAVEGGLRMAAHGQTMAGLSRWLANMGGLGSPVIDKTGLSGKYDFTLRFAPGRGEAGNAADPAPTIFTAVEEQLGLKLEVKKIKVDVVVVDHAERVPEQN